ncbi:MAG: HAMP domain-containing histidine kinase [Spirochaetales bacterium]|nr:HAMP domain-containing histidine kinase [Spirochaetales bacterium]
MKNHFVIYVMGILLFIAVITLAILQSGWVDQAAEAKKENIYRNMQNRTNQASDQIRRDFRLIESMLSIEPQIYKNKDWSGFYKNIQFLLDDTNLKEYLQDLYLLPFNQSEAPYQYNYDTGKFEVITIPPNFIKIKEIDTNAWIPFPMHYNNKFYIIPINEHLQNRRPDRAGSTLAVILIKFDLDFFYSTIMPAYLNQIFPEYAFSITDGAKIYFKTASLNNSHSRKPDFVFPLYDTNRVKIEAPPPDPTTLEGQNSEHPESEIRKNFLFFRYFQNIDNPAQAIVLEIFYPDMSFEDSINQQTLTNRILSISILTLLFFSSLFLYWLYSRLTRIRSQEQEFVASISHELRTPLAVITSTSDNLLSGIINDQEQIKKYGNVINGQAKRLSQMVENILFYSGLEKTQRHFDSKSATDIINLADQLINIHRDFYPAINFQHEYSLHHSMVQVDPKALNLIMENLFINAIRHGTINKSGIVRIILRPNIPKGIKIIIEDEGPGILQKDQKRIFQAFIRGERTVKNQTPGNGLGLHLVKRICDLLSGTIKIESPYYNITNSKIKGSRFIVTLPIEAIENES